MEDAVSTANLETVESLKPVEPFLGIAYVKVYLIVFDGHALVFRIIGRDAFQAVVACQCHESQPFAD